MINVTNYEAILPKGKENAIDSHELAERLGFESVRKLQIDVSRSREAGQIILSATTGGYYTPRNDAEIEEFVAVLRARAINTFKALKSAKERLRENQNQLNIDDYEEEK